MVTSCGEARVLRVRCPDADEVQVAGDFNHWSIPGLAMARVAPETWELTLLTVPAPSGPNRVGYFALKYARRSDARGAARAAGDGAEPSSMIVGGQWLEDHELLE